MYTFGLGSTGGGISGILIVDTQLEFQTLDELTELCFDTLELTLLEIVPEEPDA